MQPLDTTTGKTWETMLSNAKFQDINRAAEADLLRLDEARSNGRLNAENEYCTYALEGDDADPGALFVVDQNLVGLKHSGQDTRRLREKRWAEFCSVPRDQEVYRAKLQERHAKDVASKQIAAGLGLEEAVRALASANQELKKATRDCAIAEHETLSAASNVLTETIIAEPPKRAPGRPAGSKNRAKIEL